jgi:hypothetical protein
VSSRPAATPVGNPGTDRRAGRRVWGRLSGRLFRSSKSREQKKLAPSFPSANVISANVWAMVDFPCPGEAVQPENALVVFACQPTFNLPQDILPRSLQAPLPVPAEVTGPCGTTDSVENGEVRRFLSIGQPARTRRKGVRLTMSRQLLS